MKKILKIVTTDNVEMFVIHTDNDNFFTNAGKYLTKIRDNSVVTSKTITSKIVESRIPAFVTKNMNEMYRQYKKIENTQKKIEELQQELSIMNATLKNKANELNNNIALHNKEVKLKNMFKSVSGKEHCNMSFYDGSLDRDWVECLLKKNTTREIIYTYGFAYKNPTTYKKPITLEKALEILQNQCLLDITADNKYIHLNAYSSNDMW